LIANGSVPSASVHCINVNAEGGALSRRARVIGFEIIEPPLERLSDVLPAPGAGNA
jgi:hypothetical protein